jgi:hypothetical protein
MRTKQRFHKYPYIILGSIHILLLVYSFYKSKDKKKHIVLLLNYAGFAYIFEYIVVALLNGYIYKPTFINQKNLDNIFGAIWSQFFYVPVTALFITVMELGWKMKLLFSLYFVLIERLFIYLGTYKNKWWKTKYTFIMILISFFINDKWNEQLSKKNPFILFISFFNLVQVTWMNIIYIFAVLRVIRYGKWPFFTWKQHFAFAPLVGLIASLIIAWLVKSGRFITNISALLMMLIMDSIVVRKRLLKVKTPLLILPLKYSIILTAANYYRKLVYGDTV